MRFQQFQYHNLRIRSLPWYWTLALGILAAVLIGFFAVAAIVGVAILGIGYGAYKLSRMVSGLFGKIQPNGSHSGDEIMDPRQDPRRRSPEQLEVIDIEVEQVDRD